MLSNVRDRYRKSANSKWGERNSIIKNENYIETLLQNIKFDKHQFMMDGYGDCNLELTQGLEEFKIEIDKDDGIYKIFKRNKSLNPRQKEKYRLVKDFKCDDILELLQYIKTKDTMIIENINN